MPTLEVKQTYYLGMLNGFTTSIMYIFVRITVRLEGSSINLHIFETVLLVALQSSVRII